MKKVLSIVLTCFLALTIMSPLSTVFAWEASTTDADLYVGIMGDAHVQSGTTGSVTAALNAFNTMAGGADNLDGLALNGDMVYNSSSTTVSADHYTALYSAIDATNADTPLIYAMGNHEYPLSQSTDESITAPARELFVQETGQDLLYHTTFGDAENDHDYHFITAHTDSYNGDHSTETENWMMAEIDKAIAADSTNANADGETFAQGVTPNSVKPVFVMLHHPIEGTASRATADYYSDEFIAYLKTRPQVIVFTGHRHFSYRRAEQMWQDGFTVFMTPLLSNSTVTAVGHDAFGTTVNEHGAVMLEVKDNVVSLQVFDVSSNELIGDPWVIDIPNMVADRTDADATNDNAHYTWSPDKRAAVVAPAFPEDAKVKVTLDDRDAKVTFTDSAVPTETPNQRDGIVFAYKVALYNDAGALISTKTPATKYYEATYTPAPKTSMSVDFTGLEYNKEYTVKVFPLAPFATGDSIETVFETETVTYGTPMTFEAEDYAARESDIETNANASGENDEYIYVYMTTEDPSVSIPVTIENSGYYDILYALGQDTTGGFTSKVTTTITDSEGAVTTLGTNDSTYKADLCTNGNWPSGSVRMRLYEKQYMYLKAGTYTVDFTASLITKAPNKNTYICAYDYVSFTQVTKPNAANETYYEGEDYKTVRLYASATATEYTEGTVHVATNASFHGGAYADSNFSGSNRAEVDVPVTVDEEGTYYLTFKTICNQAYRVSKTTLTLDGSVIFTTSPAPSATNFWQEWEFPVTLKEGTNTITVTSYKAGSNANVYMYWDYIRISDKQTPIHVEKITKDKTIIQAEDYQIYRMNGGVWYPSTNNIVSDTTASGGTYLDSVYENPGGTKYLDIPVKIYNGGYYTITPRLQDKKSESAYTLYVDGSLKATLSTSSQALGWFETGTKVLLTEGEHTISIRSTGASNHCRIVADCVTLTYDNPKVTVPAEGKLIEAENNPLLKTYLKTTTKKTTTDEEGNETTTSEVTEVTDMITTGTTVEDASASGGSKISYNYWKHNDSSVTYLQKVTWDQPISVTKAGKYVITYTVNQSANYHAKIFALLDGVDLEQATSVGTGTPGLTTVTYLKDLTEGDHTVSVRAERHAADNCTLVVDCVNIVPVESAFEAALVNDEKTSMVELETYKDSMFVGNTGKLYTAENRVAESESYSGGKALYSDYQNGTSPSSIYVTFPINVTETGKYDVEFSVTGVEDYRSDGITLYIDDVAKQTSNHAGYTTLKTYELDSVSLTEGVHMVKLEITRRYNSNAHGTLDYIKFMPNEETTYDSTSGKAKASINVDTVGAVIIALYDADEKVCGVYTETITEAKSVKATEIVCATAPVTCKVFVWEDLININPLIDAREITIQ